MLLITEKPRTSCSIRAKKTGDDMAKGNSVGIEGGKELAVKFQKIGREVGSNVEQALVIGALRVERDAKINAPVDTGRLRSSITHRLIDNEKNNPVVEVGTSISYAVAQEFGTTKMPAQPYLYPAYLSNKKKILQDIAKAIREGCGL